MNLAEVAGELAARLTRIFLPDAHGCRPCHGSERGFADDPHWQDLILYYECFHGDNGRGVGASHQTGWTALVTRLLEMVPVTHARPGGRQLSERSWREIRKAELGTSRASIISNLQTPRHGMMFGIPPAAGVPRWTVGSPDAACRLPIARR